MACKLSRHQSRMLGHMRAMSAPATPSGQGGTSGYASSLAGLEGAPSWQTAAQPVA